MAHGHERVRSALLLALLEACGGGGSDGSGPESPPAAAMPVESRPPGEVRIFAESAEDFPNPERGPYHWIDLVAGQGISSLRSIGATLGFASVSLAAYRGSPLAATFLQRLSSGLAASRTAGIKIVLRFKYSSSLSEADAPKARILEHIGQLSPVLRDHADAIAVLQAGFIGAWGEWHHSYYGLDNAGDRAEILNALLAATPQSLMLQVRTPHFKAEILGSEPLAELEAFTGTPRARVGQHNDAFLASGNDFGTYLSPVEAWKDWVAREGRFLPVGGETAALNPPRSDGPSAILEMERLRWSFISFSYHGSVLSTWEAQGSTGEIRRRLGYRFHLTEGSWPAAVKPGGRLDLALRLRNSGFAAPFNERPLYVVLSNALSWHAARLEGADPRRWEPGPVHEVASSLAIPATLPEGLYRLALWMPDPSARLQARPEYAVRLANVGLWDPSTGLNVLDEGFRIDSAAP